MTDGRLTRLIERSPRWQIALVATLVHAALYALPNHFQLLVSQGLPLTAVDRAVPFWPLTAWLYWSDYVLVFVAFRACRRPGSATRFARSLFVLVGLGTAMHWLIPIEYPRALYPLGDDVDPLTSFVFTWFRRLDTPASCMPSLHVAASYLAAFQVWREDTRVGRWLIGWATLIFLSTLTTKQHYLVDGLAGIVLALAVVCAPRARRKLGADASCSAAAGAEPARTG